MTYSSNIFRVSGRELRAKRAQVTPEEVITVRSERTGAVRSFRRTAILRHKRSQLVQAYMYASGAPMSPEEVFLRIEVI